MKILLPAACVLCCTAATAQTPHLAVKVGGNLTTITTPGTVNSDKLTGAMAGVGIVMPLGQDKRWALSPDVLYSMKGASHSGTLRTYNERLHYIDFCVPGRLLAGNFYVEAGPQLSLLLAASNDILTGANDADAYNRVVVGLAGGIGYQLPTGPFAAFRYGHDITAMDKGARDAGTNKNVVFQLQVGYVFKKGGE